MSRRSSSGSPPTKRPRQDDESSGSRSPSRSWSRSPSRSMSRSPPRTPPRPKTPPPPPKPKRQTTDSEDDDNWQVGWPEEMFPASEKIIVSPPRPGSPVPGPSNWSPIPYSDPRWSPGLTHLDDPNDPYFADKIPEQYVRCISESGSESGPYAPPSPPRRSSQRYKSLPPQGHFFYNPEYNLKTARVRLGPTFNPADYMPTAPPPGGYSPGTLAAMQFMSPARSGSGSPGRRSQRSRTPDSFVSGSGSATPDYTGNQKYVEFEDIHRSRSNTTGSRSRSNTGSSKFSSPRAMYANDFEMEAAKVLAGMKSGSNSPRLFDSPIRSKADTPQSPPPVARSPSPGAGSPRSPLSDGSARSVPLSVTPVKSDSGSQSSGSPRSPSRTGKSGGGKTGGGKHGPSGQ